MDKSITQLRQNIERARAGYLAIVHTGNASEVYEASQLVKKAQADLASLLTTGAKECPTCGNQPHGVIQEYMVRRDKREGFEVGCLKCAEKLSAGKPSHRAFGVTPDEAVENWNGGPERWLT